MLTGKLGQQVLPGLLPPAWVQCLSQGRPPPTGCLCPLPGDKQEEWRRVSHCPKSFQTPMGVELATHMGTFTARPPFVLKCPALSFNQKNNLFLSRLTTNNCFSCVCSRSSLLPAVEQDQLSSLCPGASSSLS